MLLIHQVQLKKDTLLKGHDSKLMPSINTTHYANLCRDILTIETNLNAELWINTIMEIVHLWFTNFEKLMCSIGENEKKNVDSRYKREK